MDSKFWANVALCVVLGILVVLGLSRLSSALTPKGLFVEDPEPSAEAAPLMQQVTLLDYSLAEKPGQMVKARFTVQNESARDIRDLDILCEFYDRNGKYVDRKHWLLADTIPAGSRDSHSWLDRRFVNTRAGGVRCRIADFRVVGEPFFKLHRAEEGHGGEHGMATDEGHPASHGGHEVHGEATHH
ncbi:hypothetical protein ACLG6S_02810 [Thermodesulfobacteriota bacterium B35]